MQEYSSDNWIQKRMHTVDKPYIPLGVSAVGCYRVNRKWTEHWHARWFAELFWGVEGEGRFQYGDQEIEVTCDDIFVYFPGTEHRIRSSSSNWKYCWVVLDHADCIRWIQGFGLGEGRHVAGTCPLHRFTAIRDALQMQSMEGEYTAAHEMHALLLDAARNHRKPSNSLMAQAKTVLDVHYADPNLTIQSLADELSMHRTTLFRKFRDQYGLTPSDYLKNLRLHTALQMVQQGETSVQEISRQCGYNDPNYLTRLVKKHLGKFASDIRRENNLKV